MPNGKAWLAKGERGEGGLMLRGTKHHSERQDTNPAGKAI